MTSECMDCGVDTMAMPGGVAEYYALRDEVWWAAVAASGAVTVDELQRLHADLWPSGLPIPDDQVEDAIAGYERYGAAVAGMLCIGCLEQRLGRQVGPEDFSGAPINTGLFIPHTERLRSRIEGRNEREDGTGGPAQEGSPQDQTGQVRPQGARSEGAAPQGVGGRLRAAHGRGEGP